jgi:ATP-dependent protease Clp ATPase subunit
MKERKCSFCGKENNALVAGSLKNDVYICDDCVSACSKIFFNEKTDPFLVNLNKEEDEIIHIKGEIKNAIGSAIEGLQELLGKSNGGI